MFTSFLSNVLKSVQTTQAAVPSIRGTRSFANLVVEKTKEGFNNQHLYKGQKQIRPTLPKDFIISKIPHRAQPWEVKNALSKFGQVGSVTYLKHNGVFIGKAIVEAVTPLDRLVLQDAVEHESVKVRNRKVYLSDIKNKKLDKKLKKYHATH
eukprot:TRINITY_DN76382_c0_g1_i1.p1 TRINITY_DN76382_c0_g1~~TRINITY_DN76382_c0_g1_i1.p1  ORF type:complete len:152 (+),score=23.52 TRINITY_DN76382_c0_g1_i1:85-540(+)